MFAFQLIADALNLPPKKARSAGTRLVSGCSGGLYSTSQADGCSSPNTTVGHKRCRQSSPTRTERPMGDFFGKPDKLEWLREQVAAAGGNAATVDVEVTVLRQEQAQREADTQSLVLPGLTMSGEVTLRTIREKGEVLGSILDYCRWLGLVDAKTEWHHWLREEFRSGADLHNFEIPSESIAYVEKQIATGQGQRATPFANFAGYKWLTKLSLRKSKIAQAVHDRALTVLGQVSVGDQRLHATLDANAAQSSEPARAFVLGVDEAAAQGPRARKRDRARTSGLDLDELEKAYIEDDSLDPEAAARRLARVAIVRQNGESGVLVKRQQLADVERIELETKAVVAERQADSETRIEALHAERDKVSVKRAQLLAEKRAVEEDAKAASEERERRRAHTAELAAEQRKAEIRAAASQGLIAQEAADALLDENRQTLILRFEEWIRRHCSCSDASRCSSTLSRKFNEAVSAGHHVKPASNKDETGRWKLFNEHDGAFLVKLHQELHDRRSGLPTGQSRLVFPH